MERSPPNLPSGYRRRRIVANGWMAARTTTRLARTHRDGPRYAADGDPSRRPPPRLPRLEDARQVISVRRRQPCSWPYIAMNGHVTSTRLRSEARAPRGVGRLRADDSRPRPHGARSEIRTVHEPAASSPMSRPTGRRFQPHWSYRTASAIGRLTNPAASGRPASGRPASQGSRALDRWGASSPVRRPGDPAARQSSANAACVSTVGDQRPTKQMIRSEPRVA